MLKPAPLTVLVALSDVNAPDAGAVPPSAGGLANRLLNPAPEAAVLTDSVPMVAVPLLLSVVLVSVVKVPVLGVPLPMGPGVECRATKPLPLTVPLAARVVNDPAAAAVPPIAGGLARYVLKPEPLTVELALRLVNAPPAGAVPPMAGGLANSVVKPAPDTVLVADRVVKAPVLGEPEPIGPGEAIRVTKPAPLTVLDALSVVKAPVLGVLAPTVMLLMEPAVPISVVNVPAAGAVPPIAGGLARYVLKPVPETVEDAARVVKEPVLGVEAPTVMLLIEPAVPIRVVNVPAAGAVPPMAGGLAR